MGRKRVAKKMNTDTEEAVVKIPQRGCCCRTGYLRNFHFPLELNCSALLSFSPRALLRLLGTDHLLMLGLIFIIFLTTWAGQLEEPDSCHSSSDTLSIVYSSSHTVVTILSPAACCKGTATLNEQRVGGCSCWINRQYIPI